MHSDNWELSAHQLNADGNIYHSRREIPRLAEHDDIMKHVQNTLEIIQEEIEAIAGVE